MIISHKYKLFFVHIPKTGGALIAQIIKQNDPQAFLYLDTHTSLNKAEKYLDYFKFSIARNPYTIQASDYRFKYGNVREDQTKKYGKISFKEFITHKTNATWNQHEYILTNTPTKIDHVGRYEDLKRCIDVICQKTGMKPPQSLEMGKSTHYYGQYNHEMYYNPELIKKVQENSYKDFKIFGYSTDFKKA